MRKALGFPRAFRKSTGLMTGQKKLKWNFIMGLIKAWLGTEILKVIG